MKFRINQKLKMAESKGLIVLDEDNLLQIIE